MFGKQKASWVAAATGVVLAATCGLALASHGWHGHGDGGRGGDGPLFLLARAAGVSKTTLASTFHGNTTLHSDFSTLRTDRQAMITCLVSSAVTSGGCTTAISNFEGAQAQLTKDKLAAWQGVFAAAPNLGNASTVLAQLQALKTQEHALQEQKHQILKGIFGAQTGGTSTDAASTPAE
jgi:hypothetical protein